MRVGRSMASRTGEFEKRKPQGRMGSGVKQEAMGMREGVMGLAFVVWEPVEPRKLLTSATDA